MNPDFIEDEIFQEDFSTEAEAAGFARGLIWGDEPRFEVDCIEPHRETGGSYFVRFHEAPSR